MPRLLFTILFLSLSTPALPISIYKCSADGTVTYSDVPCKDGKVIEVPKAASKTEVKKAWQKVDEEKLATELLALQRYHREAEKIAERYTRHFADQYETTCDPAYPT